MIRDIVLIGSGNVATHLAGAIKDRIHTVFSRNYENAALLAGRIGARASSDFSSIADIRPRMILVSVADNAVDSVVTAVGALDYNPLVAHTSGTVPKEVLSPISRRTGVLYPLQTFSKNTPVDMKFVPFFTEAEDSSDYDILDSLALSISGIVHHADASKRRRLHIAGVFSSNFIVALLEITDKILSESGYPLETVKPLVEATVAKAFRIGPFAAMTGPAVRGDRSVMELQSKGLDGLDQKIYDMLSEYIVKKHNVHLK